MNVRRELSSEYRRRLDALESEWTARVSTRASELEAAHALRLQQVRVARGGGGLGLKGPSGRAGCKPGIGCDPLTGRAWTLSLRVTRL
jgi:hypothetical protein